ncbi:glycosyltransferase family 39 protein [Elizabethkingia meningoseptica]|uniref:glycosyltransferase family 39 protein n=1 Tax=Elizabethkingia meningoseptica TaxID=238 RepID=UPI00301914F8
MERHTPNTSASVKTIILFSFILIKFLINYNLILPGYDLQRDEYLHLDQASHLDWGYMSVPPVTSWLSYIIQLLGNSLFWIKFFPALFGALTTVVVWKAIEELGGNLFALILGASCVTFSVLFRLNILYQPNSLDVLCWTILYYFILKYINRQQSKWIWYAAVTFAIGFLNKYNIVFAILGIIPALLLSPERKIFANRNLYFAMLLSLVLILPNLIWQYHNGFPVIHHMKELSKFQLIHVDRWNFIRSQFFFFLGNFIVIILGFFALLFYNPLKKYRLFLWSFLFTIGLFLYFRAKDYYAIGLYPIYFSFGAVYVSYLMDRSRVQILKPVCILIAIGFFIPVYMVAFPNKSPEYITKHEETYRKLGMLRWEDGKDHALPQDFADMLGWKELAAKTDRVFTRIGDPERTLVLCDNYGQAGAINFYSKKGIQAVSFNADYINWFKLNKKYIHLIRIKDRDERTSELATTAPFFKDSAIEDSITNPYAREYGTMIFSFMHAKIDINKRIAHEIATEKGDR